MIAAYVYDQVGQKDQILDMIRWFLRKRQTIPFDLVLLADYSMKQIEVSGRPGPTKPGAATLLSQVGNYVSPAWPMLTQGWARLAGRSI